MICDVCGLSAVISVNFNGSRWYDYCAKHNRLKGQKWIVVTHNPRMKAWGKEFHPKAVKRL